MRKNKIFSSLVAATILSAFAVSAHASSVALDDAPVSKTNWEVSGSLAHYSIEDFNDDVLQVSFGYPIRNPEGHFSLVPELTLGKGVNGEKTEITEPFNAVISTEIDTVLQVGTRFVLHPTDTFEVFLVPTLRKVTTDISVEQLLHVGMTSDWSFGIGAGVAANISPNLNISLSFERTKLDLDADESDFSDLSMSGLDTDVVTGKVSYRF